MSSIVLPTTNVQANPPYYPTGIPSSAGYSDDGHFRYLVETLLRRGVRTQIPVKVEAVRATDDLIGVVDVIILVTQLDAGGNSIDHGTIYNVPYMRLQAGSNGIIMDPAVGDIGLASFCDRDISGVKSALASAPPSSNRKFNYADAIYHLTIMSATAPTQYVLFGDDGIAVVSPKKVSIDAPEIALLGTTLTHNGVNIGSTHVHPETGTVTEGPE